VGIAGSADLVPPAANAVDGEGCGVMVDAEIDPAGIGGEVVDAIGDGTAEFLDQEVVHPDLLGIACRAIFATSVLEIANQFLLFRIDRDDRLAVRQKTASLFVDVFKLSIPIHMLASFVGFSVGL
jgi:hypothetical protein